MRAGHSRPSHDRQRIAVQVIEEGHRFLRPWVAPDGRGLQYSVPSYPSGLLRALLTIVPCGVLAAAVIAAEKVSFLLVGSAALWLRSEITTVADADAVIEPGEPNIHRLRQALAGIAIGPVPFVSRFLRGSVVPVMTAYGKVDCLLERGRQDWARLRRGAGFLPVAGVPVLVAASADAWDLRRRYKEYDDE